MRNGTVCQVDKILGGYSWLILGPQHPHLMGTYDLKNLLTSGAPYNMMMPPRFKRREMDGS